MKQFFTLAFCFISLIASAQSTFESVLSCSNHTAYEQKIIQLKGGSYVVLSFDSAAGPLLVKLNSKGSIVAQKTTGMSITAITATSDGGFAATGSIFFAKYDSSLNETVALNYTLNSPILHDFSAGFRSSQQIVQTPDDGFVIAGTIEQRDIGFGYFLKIRNDGSYVPNSVVEFSLQPSFSGSTLYDMTVTKDGGVVLLCSSRDYSSYSYYEVWYMLKVVYPTTGDSPSGWQKNINPPPIYDPGGNIVPIHFHTVFPTSDSGFVFTASYDGKSALCKVDVTGNIVWTKYINFSANNSILSPVETKDGGYVLVGTYNNPNSADLNTTISYLVKLGKDGMWQWNKTFRYRDSATSAFFNVIPTSDGGFAAAGDVGNLNLTNSDIVVYKFDSAFNACGHLDSDTTNPVTDLTFTLPALFDGLSASSYYTTPDTVSLVQTTTTALNSIDLCSSVLPVQLLSFNAILAKQNGERCLENNQ